MPDLYSNCAFILQSLPTGEMQTGTRLHEDLQILVTNSGKQFPTVLENIQTPDELFRAFREIEADAKTGARPILHIECHGSRDKDGIILSAVNGSNFISWDQIRQAVTPINIACNCNLLLMIGTCHGAHSFGDLLVRSVINAAPAACWGVWGPTKDICPEPLLSMQTKFYAELLSDSECRNPMKVLLNAAPKYETFFSSAQTCFEKCQQNYFEDHCSSRKMKRRASNGAAKLREEFGAVIKTKVIENTLKEEQYRFFQNCRRVFFMIDRFPENETRFKTRCGIRGIIALQQETC